MTPTPTQVREALTDLDENFNAETGMLTDNVHLLGAAARAWLDLFTECEKCGGEGSRTSLQGTTTIHSNPEYPDYSESQTIATYTTIPCPVCAGRGYTPQPERGPVSQGEETMSRIRVDTERAAQLYVESAEAQHGDVELARWEAEEWLSIFNEVLAEQDTEWHG